MHLRKATFGDVEAIHKLVNDYAQQGVMLPRSRNSIYETLRDVIIAEEDDRLVGVGSLHLSWDALAEVRALAIAPGFQRRGIGRQIVEELLIEGRALGVKTFFTLTYQPEFFGTLGFSEVTKEELPQKVWKECINCPKFPNCDEVAMVKREG
ncbi:N-acetyltransferase [Anaeromusa sp.]|jgi:amino-acid N-acetyltransferase|uniref:N-acetyltransferase n=1 Tax=Anaeromusa sp. TaxID=1872520 RepID=UPI00260BB2D2|nr:N-acetyltransferase [Anaeromusa sp.]MDD3158238.1 N-acetyltransferase [Anaeromusa sp.]NCB75497.1 N-acetyltransferase [Negativicutes bacterium]